MPDRALWERAQRAGAQGHWQAAVAAYAALVRQDPAFVPGWLELSLALEQLDQYRDSLRAALSAARPGKDVHPLVAIAVVRRLRRFELVPEMARYVEAAGLPMRLPAERLVDLAGFFSSAGLHDESIAWARHAVQLKPGLFDAHNMLGLALMFAGRTRESVASFERALALSPRAAQVYSTLSRVAPGVASSSRVDAIRRQLSTSPLDVESEVHLGYALHNELHALGEYDDAWKALDRAMRARRSTLDYDTARTLAMFDSIRKAFDQPLRPPALVNLPEVVPIFIVGMHRSGTTLLERMLAGHPQVTDAGETYVYPAALRFATNHFCNTAIDGVIVDRLPGVDRGFVASRFLEVMSWRGRGSAFVTEKLNPNFQLVGSIVSTVPGARLVHMSRAATDTCFSNLRTMFTVEAAYSYDQVEIADFFRAYVDLMSFWDERCPGAITTIDYAGMVADPRQAAQKVAASCGMAFSEAMLEVDRQRGSIATASVDVARKGFLKDRGGAWDPYRRQLAPMLDRLAKHGLA